jgi:hypothetical protein
MTPPPAARGRRRGARPLGLAAVVAALAMLLLAGADWVDEYRAGSFRIKANFALAPHTALFDDLVDLKADLALELELEFDEPPVVDVLLFRDRASYRRYLLPRVPQGASRPALYVKSKTGARIYAHWRNGLAADLRHEGTHALLHAVLPAVPLWLDEGLAEYFEVPAGERAFGNPHLAEIQRAVKLGWKPNLAALQARKEMPEMSARDYRDAWAWVHYMLHGGEEPRAVLHQYLSDLQAGVPPGDLGKNLRSILPDLEDRVVRHFANWGR